MLNGIPWSRKLCADGLVVMHRTLSNGALVSSAARRHYNENVSFSIRSSPHSTLWWYYHWHRISIVMMIASATFIGFPCSESTKCYSTDSNIEETTTKKKKIIGHNGPVLLSSSDVVEVCHPWVSVWRRQDRLVYILGTTHAESYSVQMAGDLVRNVKPDAVFLEFDYDRMYPNMLRFSPTIRHDNLTGSSANTTNTSITKSTTWLIPEEESITDWNLETSDSQKVVPVPKFRQLILKPVSSQFGAIVKNAHRMEHHHTGTTTTTVVHPSSLVNCEFVRAAEEGHKLGATIVLGDRDSKITKALLVKAEALDNAVAVSQIRYQPDVKTTSYNNNYGQDHKEDVKLYQAQLQLIAPATYQAKIVQRDAYMANGLDCLQQFPTIVAIVGKSHVDGIERQLQLGGWNQVLFPCSTITTTTATRHDSFHS